MKHSEGYVGMQVYFGRENGEQTLGKIVKINPKKFKVEQLESRGTRKSHNIGTVWTVPPSLCSPATDVPGGDYATKSDSEVTVLYQSIAKEDMESNTKQTISDEEWEEFVDRYQDAFAEEVSVLAMGYWYERATTSKLGDWV